MRLRNVKNKEELMKNSSHLLLDGKIYRGKWHTYFHNTHPIHVEIGCGKGQFLIQMASCYPEINFIGIEQYDSVIVRTLQKVPEDLDNLCFIRMNALDIEEVFDHEVDCIYLNFSDPWPKNRQEKRRLTSPIFLHKYDHVFAKDAHIIQKTDNRQLFEYSLVSLSTYGYQLEQVSLDLHHSDFTSNIMSEYEERFVQLGQPIYRLEAVKKMTNKVKNL